MTLSFSSVNEKEIECYYSDNNEGRNNVNNVEKTKGKRRKILRKGMKKKEKNLRKLRWSGERTLSDE